MSFHYNRITLVGRLTRDPEYKKVSEDTAKLMFTLAVGRSYRDDDGEQPADFIPVVLWGRNAEFGSQLLKKGSPTLITGRLQIREYSKDDQKRWYSEVIGEQFQLLQSKEKEPVKA